MGGAGDLGVATATRFGTLQNLIKPFIGAGILALPSAFKSGGVLASAILMAILAVGVNYCIRCLLTSVDYVYAREHGLDYDITSGIFSANSEDPPLARRSIQSEENGDGLYDATAPLTASGARTSDEDEPTQPAAIALASRSPAASSSNRRTTTKVLAEPMDPALAAPLYSFREIGEFAYGRAGCWAVDINLVASQVGFCIAYMSFISQNMDQVITHISRVEWIFILFGGWSLLVQIRDIRKIAFTSGFGNLVYLVSLAIIFYDGFSSHCCVSAHDTAWIRIDGLALVFGTGCFALEGIGLILPVKRAMKEKDLFGSVLNIAITFVATCYIVFGVLGYLFYGDAVKSVITDNLGGGALSDAVRVSLSISLFFTYAIQLFPVSEIMDELWDTHVFRIGGVGASAETAEKYQALQGDRPGVEGGGAQNDHVYDSFAATGSTHLAPPSPMVGAITEAGRPTNVKREFALVSSRIGLVAFTAVISIVFPNFGLIVSLVGSFSNSAIAFILPQIFYIRLVLQPEAERTGTKLSDDWWTRWKSFLLPYIIIVLGICASIIGVYTTIKSMVDGDDS